MRQRVHGRACCACACAPELHQRVQAGGERILTRPPCTAILKPHSLAPSSGAKDGQDARHVARHRLHQQRAGHSLAVQVHVSGAHQRQQRAQHARRVHVVAQRAVHLHLGALKSPRQLALAAQPGELRSAAPGPQQRLDGVEELAERAVRRHRLLALHEGACTALQRSELHGLRPVMQQEEETQLPRAVAGQRGSDGDEILEGLAHLEPLYVQVPCTQSRRESARQRAFVACLAPVCRKTLTHWLVSQ